MFQFISALVLFATTVLSVFCETRKNVGGWSHKKLTRYGWIFLVLSGIAFLASAGATYITQSQKRKAASIEINLGCANVLHPFAMLGVIDSIRKAIAGSGPDEAAVYSQQSHQHTLAIWHTAFSGDAKSLIDCGASKDLLDVGFQYSPASTSQTMQQEIEIRCKALQLQLSDIMGRYQSVLSSGQTIGLLNLRENTLLRSICETEEYIPRPKLRLRDYVINQRMLDDFLHEVDNVQNGRFMPF